MRKYSAFLALVTFLLGYQSFAFGSKPQPPKSPKSSIVVVLNRANWCSVCKANEQPFKEAIEQLNKNQIELIVNDLTNDSTVQASAQQLKRLHLYKKVYATNRKGMGKMLQSCGLVRYKNKSLAAGTVVVINTTKNAVVLEQSIAGNSEAILQTIQANL